MNKIITIGREFGSGGRELGRIIAQELGINYYDKEIITEIAKDTSLSVDYIKQTIDKRKSSVFPLSIGNSLSYVNDYQVMQLQDIFRSQTKIIRALAENGDCVIIGRCADYILRDLKPCRIFVYADLEARVKRCMEHKREDELNFTENEMRRHIQALDKHRASYYNDYTFGKWGDKSNYDLCINTTGVDIEQYGKMIARMF